jgi:hypothetical protein
MGSCFAENIGEALESYKFSTQINPHGVLYNPKSIATALIRYIENNAFAESELFYANECWKSWEHHSRYSDTDKNNCLSTINTGISSAHHFLKEADWLFITFGSAFVYRHNSTGEFVGNCHKVPQKEFSKVMMNSSEIITEYSSLLEHLKAFNPKLKVIFTVSPVRYIRDGVTENTLSKAQLIQAVHILVKKYPDTFYFPAYELMMDDLRDYRFYKSDMVHPTEQAISYIFEKLMHSTFSKESKIVFEKVKDILTALHHRPFHTDTEAHRKFKVTYAERCRLLQKEYSFLNLEEELNYFVHT